MSPRLARLLLPALLLLPLPAFSAEQCRHSQPRALKLDLAGVDTVVFDIGHNTLRLQGKGGDGSLQGRACASDPDLFAQLELSQRRDGDVLHVRLRRNANKIRWFGGSEYAYLDLAGAIPRTLAVRLNVGSGDAQVDGAASLDLDLGSGDVQAGHVQGPVRASVGSGDVVLQDTGTLRIDSVGSGDIRARGVRGDVTVGGIGSGDFALHGASGRVRIGSVGSGDLTLRDVAGAIRIDSIGSGDLDVRDCGGGLSVGSIGSGDIEHHNVAGPIELPRRR